jgi:hypothetical protein
MTTLLFGEDGLRAPGAQLSVLIPKLPWFATFYAEALSVAPPEDGGLATFGGGKRGPASLVYTGVLEQFWSISDATSLLLGMNVAAGHASTCDLPPCTGGPRSFLYGGDLYFKWRPTDVVGESTSVTWATEYFARHIDGLGTEGTLYTEPLLQLHRRFFFGLRYDLTGIPRGAGVPRRQGIAASVTFAPTEFSRLRLYGQRLSGPDVTSCLVGFVQAEFSIGAHGAHPF